MPPVIVAGYQQATLRKVSKTITFDGTAGAGAVGTVTVFTVTGEISVVQMTAYCSTNLTEAAPTATLSLGVTSSATLLIGSTTATDIDAGEFWVDTGPDANGVAIPAALKDIVITDNIIATVGSQAVDAGVIRFDLYYLPVSGDGAAV